MTIFFNTLRRLLRNKFNVFTIFFLTPLAIGLLFGLGHLDIEPITIGLVDLDSTDLTRVFRETVATSSQLIELAEEDIENALIRNKVGYVLVIEEGFTEELLSGGQPRWRSNSILGSNVASRFVLKAEGFAGAVQGLAATAQGDRDKFYAGLANYLNGIFTIETATFNKTSKSIESTLQGMGILAFIMLTLSTYTTTNLIKDRDNRTFYRVMASPKTLKSYMVQSILSFFLILLSQVTVTLLAVKWIFGFYLGPAPLKLFFIMAVFALLCVAMGIALAALARTPRQANTIASLIITPMSMLSGLYWPRTFMPPFLQAVGRYLPPTWAIDAATKVMMGKSLADAGLELAILMGFIVAFFLLGTWRRADVAK